MYFVLIDRKFEAKSLAVANALYVLPFTVHTI